MEYVSYVAKGLMAFVVAGLAAIVQYNVDVNPWVLVVGAALVAGLAVYLIPNGDKPS